MDVINIQVNDKTSGPRELRLEVFFVWAGMAML